MAASDYLELPDYIENVIPIDIGPAMADYEELEREMYLELAGLEVEAVNAAVLTSKCHQYAQGQLYGEEGTWEAVHSAKLEALEDVIEEAAGQPVLVAYTFKSDLERLQQRFGGARVLDNDPATVEAWNCGEIPLLLAHPASAGHGLNLQRGGHILAWYGLNWSLELDQQMNARLHRQGQEHPVMVHRLVASGTVDEAILERLREKCTAQEALLKRMQKSVAEGV
jgi:SNF2 family DNA or RNA helicase